MKILMVCLGNICRSPLAEGIMRYKIKQNNLPVIVDSAGTISFHVGNSPDKRSILVAKNHGINISDLVARQFTVNDFDDYDKIFVMDSSNYSDVVSLARSKTDKEKVDLILNTTHPGKNKAVPDPYWGGEDGFEEIFRTLDDACDAIIKKLKP